MTNDCPACKTPGTPTGKEERRLFPWQGKLVHGRSVFNVSSHGHSEYEVKCPGCGNAWWSLDRPSEAPS